MAITTNPTNNREPNTVNHSVIGPPIFSSKSKVAISSENAYITINLGKSLWRISPMLISIKTIKLRIKKRDDASRCGLP